MAEATDRVLARLRGWPALSVQVQELISIGALHPPTSSVVSPMTAPGEVPPPGTPSTLVAPWRDVNAHPPGSGSELAAHSYNRARSVSDELARQILERLSTPELDEPLPDSDLAAREIVFEVDLGGRAYLLICRPLQKPLPTLGLSPREKEIIRLVAKGLPNKAIAQVLDISLWTVATHVRRVFAKLGVGTRAEMIAKTLEQGLLEPAGEERKAAAARPLLASVGSHPV